MNWYIDSDHSPMATNHLFDIQAQDNAVCFENIAVRYRVPTTQTRSLKNFIVQYLQGKVTYRDHWALRNINLHLRHGEVLGLIGRNGAGKSTLLKVAARVIKPTKGRVVVKGKVAPLLGLGTGFHPELTGRENIFLNGTLLGFTTREMEEKFERIVDFAELWGFINAPLRTYSSGMRARLGFAIATDTKPDILIVDEILSVGDAAFREKSTDRMDKFRHEGSAILLVSHSMGMIENICNQVAWIHKGQVRMLGEPDEVIHAYLPHREKST